MAHVNVVSSLCSVVRRSVHEKVPPYPVRNELAGDWIHWYLLMTTGDYARINHPVCDYRVHPDGLYQTFMRSPTYGTALAEAYDALIAWPTLPKGDIQHLRRGRARARGGSTWRVLGRGETNRGLAHPRRDSSRACRRSIYSAEATVYE